MKIKCAKCQDKISIESNDERLKTLSLGESKCPKCGNFRVGNDDLSYLIDGIKAIRF